MAQQKPRDGGDREIIVSAVIVDMSGDPIYQSKQSASPSRTPQASRASGATRPVDAPNVRIAPAGGVSPG